ncbi:uncharacterized protein LOC135391611 isoform X1 [Ornithodoros turicata]|uniref:uncharacterized protein LOC135391611 isoform X1 n=1 Tax=Ornithodoros turicata TaxID=34597 RepID=UPI00313A2722
MSVSDPLLKELRDHIIELRRHNLAVEIDDSNQLLLPFCVTLEGIFRKGLKTQVPTALGCIKKDYWNVFHCLLLQKDRLRLPFKVATAIQSVSEFKKVQTSVGRGRLLIRVLLKRQVMSVAVASCLSAKKLLEATYDPLFSILGNEILAEIFLSLLHAVDQVRFCPVLRNASFLDATWQLGVYKQHELVPCTSLGISIRFVAGHAVVVRVAEGSVAAEDDKVRVGDVVDELFGESLRYKSRRFAASLLDHFEGLPVYLAVIRRCYSDGAPYPPVEELFAATLPKVNLDTTSHTTRTSSLFPEVSQPMGIPVNPPQNGCGYSAIYLGETCMGKRGGVLQVERGIGDVVSRTTQEVLWVSSLASTTKWNAILEVEDCYVRAFHQNTKQEILWKHYTEVASCGKRMDMPCVLAIIAGETTCTVAENFICYVFQVQDENICQMVLSSIAQGFQRTSWSV